MNIGEARSGNSLNPTGVGVSVLWDYDDRKESVSLIFEVDEGIWSIKAVGFKNYDRIPEESREGLLKLLEQAVNSANNLKIPDEKR